MPGKQKDEPLPPVSPILFITVDGDPMSFYLRPGPMKQRYQPVIAAGGGAVCNVQQPRAILLIDPEEQTSIPESTGNSYVSTQYIQDCVEKNEQLDLESYRLNPEVIQRRSSKRSSSSSSPRSSAGRMAYTSEDDAAILNYVNKHRARTGGNKLWQEMKKGGVTGHSWQSMKHRYKSQLAKNLTEDEEGKTHQDEKVEEDHSEIEGNQDPRKTSTEEEDDDNVSLHTCLSSQELAQDGEQNSTTESTQVLEMEKEPEKAAETLSDQTNEPGEEAEPEMALIPSEASQPDTDPDPTTPASAQIDNSTADSPSSQCETLIKAKPSTKIKGKQKASPTMESSQRPITRRQLKVSLSSPEPYSKKLRNHSSSSTPVSSPKPSPRTSRKTRSPLTASPKKCSTTTTKQPVAKKPRAETMDAPNTETTTTAPRKANRKEKRQLGILELAAMEFEDDRESESELELEDKILEEQEEEEEKEEEPEASTSISVSNAEHPPPAAAEPSTSKAHLFIFDSESQAEVVSDDHPVAPPTGEAAALSLTQSQLEEDMSRIRELMRDTDQDLATVTKALLKTSGEFSAAQNLLLKPSLQVSRPLWNRSDDAGLLSADAEVRRGLEEKYGEQEVAKRIVFLEVER